MFCAGMISDRHSFNSDSVQSLRNLCWNSFKWLTENFSFALIALVTISYQNSPSNSLSIFIFSFVLSFKTFQWGDLNKTFMNKLKDYRIIFLFYYIQDTCVWGPEYASNICHRGLSNQQWINDSFNELKQSRTCLMQNHQSVMVTIFKKSQNKTILPLQLCDWRQFFILYLTLITFSL